MERLEKEIGVKPEIAILQDIPAAGPGSFFFLIAEFTGGIGGFSSLGERGKRAEEVAREAVDSLKGYIESDGCVDPHLADQLVPFMAVAKGISALTTTRITEHLLTNLWVVQQFTDVKIIRSGERGEPGKVEFVNK
jgi:RNA 3'-terminal phosphate cyclase